MLTKYDYLFTNEDEMLEIAAKLAKHLFKGAIITLEGQLGAGKTTFSKGIASGLNVTDPVSSPTFTIIKEYEGDLRFNHIDAYRIEKSDEDLGFDEYFYGDGVTVIEWGSKIADQIPKERLHIAFYNVGGTKRLIEVFPLTKRYNELCEVVFDD